jgi:hypothetical protein
MTFLNSIYLAALAAIIVPLLIHFLSRRRIKIIYFSSLRFLFQMQKTKLRWLKIRELLLLILRMLILAMIALAFARPALTGKHGSSHAPASVVLLLDNSPSSERLSSGGFVYDEIKQGASQIIDMLNANDEISLITLSGKPAIVGPVADFARARQALYATQPQGSPPNFKDGLNKAAEILSASHNLNREVYILTDLQAGGSWDKSFEKAINPALNYFVISYTNDEYENVGLTNIQFPSQLLAPDEEFSIAASVRNYSNKAFGGRLVGLFIDNKKKAQTAIDLKPFGSATTQFAITPESPGRHRGYFEIEDDDYSPDNRFYFDFQIPAKISVLGTAENQEDLNILTNCLGRGDLGYIDFKAIMAGEFSRQDLAQFNVIILNNISALPQANINSINDFLGSGGGLFLILGNNSKIETYRDFLGKKASLKAGPKISARGAQEESYFELKDFDLTHPIFKIYSPQSRESVQIPPLKIASFNPLEGGVPLATLADKRVILAGSVSSKIIVMGTGLDRASSDISIHSFVVPFVIRTVEYLASEISPTQEYFMAGQPATINLPANTKAVSAKLNGPATDMISPVSRGAYGAFVNLPEVGLPGFYTLSDGADTLAVFAVNHDSTESTGQIVPVEHLKEIFGKDMAIIKGKDNIKSEVVTAKFGLELWKYCLAVALLLLIIESFLVRERKN